MSQDKKQTKKKSSKKILIGILVVAVAIGGGGYYYLTTQAKTAAAMTSTADIQTTTLQKTTITNYIAASGTIYSGNSQNVYTTQNYPVKEIFVEVGDVVKKGDVLATLDMTNLDYDIKQAELNLENARKSASDSVQTASSNIQNAQQSIQTSKLTLEKQQLNYDIAKEKLANGTSNDLISAQNTIDSTQQALDNAKVDSETKTDTYNANKQLFDAGIISKSEMDSVQIAMDNAVKSLATASENYDKALDTYKRAVATLEQDLVTAQKDLQSANLNYGTSQNSLKQAQSKSANTTSTVETQEISLTKLKEQRLESEIVAPIDGTITTLNATVGSTASGSSGSGTSGTAMFVVQDMNDLYVSSSVKEFRVGEVKIGQEALVTTDATTGQTFKGQLDFIAPTATSTSSTSNVEFEIKVKLLEVSENLKIGMNAYANIVLQSDDNIYAVPSDAVKTSQTGETSVYVSEKGVVGEIVVKTGIETDTLTEISSDKLNDGMVIYSNADQVSVGETVATQTGTNGQFGGGQKGERPARTGEQTGEQTGARPDTMQIETSGKGAPQGATIIQN